MTKTLWAGPSEIFQDRILPNPGIPRFFGTGFPNIFDPGILLKSFGIFWDFHFCFICLSNRIIFINIYHHHQPNHHHYHCHSSSPFIEIIISDCVERASLLYVAFYVLSQSAVKIMHLPHQSQLKCVFKVSPLNVSVVFSNYSLTRLPF